MKKRKRVCALMLALVLATGALTACAQQEKKDDYTSIFTGNPNAIRVFVRANSTYAEALEKQFPDIDFDFYYYGGLNTTMTLVNLLEKDDLGDLCITSLQVQDETAKDHLMNLAGYDFCGRYEPSILSQFDIDGEIYQFPGYVVMRNIIYNKDMFEKYGWKEPTNFQELLDLCRQIRKDAEGVTPIVMAAAANGYFFTTMTSYSQSEFLYTPEGQQWIKEYQKGEAKAEDGFGDGIAMVQELIDAGAFNYDSGVGLWDGDLFRERMVTGQAAMMFGWGGQQMIAQQILDSADKVTFDIMPFRNRSGQPFIGTNIPYYIGLSKGLQEKGQEKKLENALRIIDWLSTEEGLKALSMETLSAIYPLKQAENEEAIGIYHDFWDKHLDSIKAPMLYAGFEDILPHVGDSIIDAIQGKRRLDGLAEEIDEIHHDYLTGGEAAIEVGSVAKNFSHPETVQMFAQVLAESGAGEIALVSDGGYKDGVINSGGVFSRLLEGAVWEENLACCLPGANIARPVVKMTLTGSQIKELLENGKHGVVYPDNRGKMIRTESDEGAEACASFPYFWAGMQVEWKRDKVESLTLDDGRVLGDDDTCTVLFADEDYTIELEEAGNTIPLSYTMRDLFAEYLKKNSPLQPIPVLRK